MGKSSSSRKKIRSKDRARKKRKNVSRRAKSKKLRHQDDSTSCSDEDDSRSSVSASSSSSEDSHRRRRSRSPSHARRDLKRGKKRLRRRSPSTDSSDRIVHFKRRKGSKRKDDHHRRKKSHKKKYRRSPSTSPRTSGSQSHSTCQGGSGVADEIDVVRYGRRSCRNERDRRNLEKGKRKSSSRNRSRSPSSFSLCSESTDHWTEEEPIADNNSRRLRSVIIVAKEEGVELGMDELKEEIIYNHEDYPSSRSNDSNDGESKREATHELQAEKKWMENQKAEAVVSDITSAKSTVVRDSLNQDDGSNPTINVHGTVRYDSSEENASDAPGAINTQNVDDLESTLRQRALENLLKFRGGCQTNVKNAAYKEETNDRGRQLSPCGKAELVKVEVNNEGNVGARGTEFAGNEPDVGKDFVASLSNEKIPEQYNNGKRSEPPKQDFSSSLDRVVDRPKVKGRMFVGSVGSKPKAATSAQRQVSENFNNTSALQELPQAKFMITTGGIDKSPTNDAPIVTGSSSNSNTEEIEKTSGSAPLEPNLKSIEGVKSDGQKDEAKDDSQYEQKTMSVMRGGEMVQVSYKVYIPKKAPALSRRQLKR